MWITEDYDRVHELVNAKARFTGKSFLGESGRRIDNYYWQYAGMFGEYTLNTWWGDKEAFFRNYKDGIQLTGDGGSDIPGYPIDIKTKCYFTGLKNANLLVGPTEFMATHDYVLGAVITKTHANCYVALLGWAEGSKMHFPGTHDRYFDAYWMHYSDLRPMTDLKEKYGIS
jgi:hypothetical protein